MGLSLATEGSNAHAELITNIFSNPVYNSTQSQDPTPEIVTAEESNGSNARADLTDVFQNRAYSSIHSQDHGPQIAGLTFLQVDNLRRWFLNSEVNATVSKMTTVSKEVRSVERYMKNRQAEAAEDDLVRTSFHNAELQMLLTDEKLQADDAKVQHERELSQAHEDLEMAIYDLQEEKNRSAQKHILIDDLKAQVAILKTGGSSFSSRYEARAHISPEEAEAMAFRIAELEVLLEEQRNENTKLTAQLQQSGEESLPAYTEQQDHSFLPECFLTRSALPIDEEERLPADLEHKEDSFLPECFLARCPSPMNDKEEGLPADIEHKEDSFLPECFLARCPSPMDEEENLTSDMNMDIAPLFEELLINSSSLLQADSVSALEQESQDILCLSELLSSTSAVSLTSSCNGQAESQDTKMVKSQASVNKETCSGLLQSMLQEAHQILSLSAKLATPSPHHDKTEPIKVQLGQVVKTELPNLLDNSGALQGVMWLHNHLHQQQQGHYCLPAAVNWSTAL
uniref:Uncharacterized protein n=1 Tax=Branchiostoma floridae TaxID=7739 RepID=C3YIS7_BRAFL|eukprot:XP_002603790.1 hypothetical protein BRAFLDRAFT_124669 [Branchiostoma floridae]